MAALNSLNDILNRATGGAGAFENLFVTKDGRVGASAAAAPVVGRWTSLWLYNGYPAGGGAAPGAVAAPTRATTGALMQANPGGGRQKWLTGVASTINSVGTLLLYDRLLHISGLSGTSLAAQTVGGALTRYTGTASEGNQIWVEVYTQIGATGTTITASYTNQAGTPGRTTQPVAIGGTGIREAQRMIPLALAAGDTGVQSVQSVTLAGTTGTAGDFGVTVARPLLFSPSDSSGVGSVRDTIASIPGPVEVLTDACLTFAWQAGSTTLTTVFASIHSVEA